MVASFGPPFHTHLWAESCRHSENVWEANMIEGDRPHVPFCSPGDLPPLSLCLPKRPGVAQAVP